MEKLYTFSLTQPIDYHLVQRQRDLRLLLVPEKYLVDFIQPKEGTQGSNEIIKLSRIRE